MWGMEFLAFPVFRVSMKKGGRARGKTLGPRVSERFFMLFTGKAKLSSFWETRVCRFRV